MNGKLTNLQAIKQFILAGNALFTLENVNTGNHYTYRVQAGNKNGSQTRFVRVLVGAENTDASNYAYLGLIDGGVFRRTKATHISPDAQSFKAFNWLWRMMSKGKPLPEQVEFWRCWTVWAMRTVAHRARQHRQRNWTRVPEANVRTKMYTMTAEAYTAIFEVADKPEIKVRKPAVGWTHCPSCDAPLPERIFPGEEWNCAECGEYGIGLVHNA